MTVRSSVVLGLGIIIAILMPPLTKAILVKDLVYEARRHYAILEHLKEEKGEQVDQQMNELLDLGNKVDSMDNRYLWEQADETDLKLVATMHKLTDQVSLPSHLKLLVELEHKIWLANRLTSIKDGEVSKKMKQLVEKVKIIAGKAEEEIKKLENTDDFLAKEKQMKSMLKKLNADLDKLEKVYQAGMQITPNSKIARIKAQLGKVGAGAKSLYHKYPETLIGAGVVGVPLIGGGGVWAAKKIWPSKSKTELPIDKEAGNSSKTDTSTTRNSSAHIWLVVLVVLVLLIIATILATGYYAGWFISGSDENQIESSKNSRTSGQKSVMTPNKSPASSGQTTK